MNFKQKKTNDFEYTILGIDLFIKFIIKSIKNCKKSKKNKNMSFIF